MQAACNGAYHLFEQRTHPLLRPESTCIPRPPRELQLLWASCLKEPLDHLYPHLAEGSLEEGQWALLRTYAVQGRQLPSLFWSAQESRFGQGVLGIPGKGSSPEFICPPIEEDTGWPGPDGEVMLFG